MKPPIVVLILITIDLVSFVKTDLCPQRRPLRVEDGDFPNAGVEVPQNFKLHLINSYGSIKRRFRAIQRPEENVCHIYDFLKGLCHGLKMKCKLSADFYTCDTYAISLLFESFVIYKETIKKIEFDGHLINDKHVYEASITKMYEADINDEEASEIDVPYYVQTHYNKRFAMTGKGIGWKLFEFCDSSAAFVLIDADMPFSQITIADMYDTMKAHGIMDDNATRWITVLPNLPFDFKFKW